MIIPTRMKKNGETSKNQNHILEKTAGKKMTRINLSKNTNAVPNESKVVSEIHELFERYGPTFVDQMPVPSHRARRELLPFQTVGEAMTH